MKEIDIQTWERREHFNFFRMMDFPIYNICFDLDITAYFEAIRAKKISVNNALVHLTAKTVNDLENFRLRIIDGKVFLLEVIHPVFASLGKDTELFKLILTEYCDDLNEFNQSTNRRIAAQREYFPFEELKGRNDLIFISSIPWISFTGLDHTININKDDTIPRISWGKIFKRDGKTILPYNIQVNHMFIDGYHLGQFQKRMEDNMQLLRIN